MTPEVLAACTAARSDRAAYWAPFLSAAMDEFDINTPVRQAAFLAQVAHESMRLRYMAEIWGPTAAQLRYEPPHDLATRLGNTQPGDGKRFKGRGPIQCTGRYNYRVYGAKLGVDLEQFPELLDEPGMACRVSAAFWKSKGLNELADTGYQRQICKKINGGYNGLDNRLALYKAACGGLNVKPVEAD